MTRSKKTEEPLYISRVLRQNRERENADTDLNGERKRAHYYVRKEKIH